MWHDWQNGRAWLPSFKAPHRKSRIFKVLKTLLTLRDCKYVPCYTVRSGHFNGLCFLILGTLYEEIRTASVGPIFTIPSNSIIEWVLAYKNYSTQMRPAPDLSGDLALLNPQIIEAQVKDQTYAVIWEEVMHQWESGRVFYPSAAAL